MATSRKPTRSTPVPVIEAFRRAFGVEPIASSDETADFSSIASVSVWSTDRLEEYEVEPFDELMVGLHTGGAPGTRTRIDGRWTKEPSLPGQLYLIPAGHPTAWKVHGRLEFVSVHFRGTAIARLSADASVAPLDPASLPFRAGFDDAFVAASCAVLTDELRSPSERGSRYRDLVAETLALHILRSARRSTRPREPEGRLSAHVLRRVRERIESSLQTGVSLEELAREAGLSRFHFARAFKATTGASPHRYLTARRIEHAKHLLGFTEIPLAEIAFELGFSSQAHFHDRFRRATGRTPLDFRRGR